MKQNDRRLVAPNSFRSTMDDFNKQYGVPRIQMLDTLAKNKATLQGILDDVYKK